MDTLKPGRCCYVDVSCIQELPYQSHFCGCTNTDLTRASILIDIDFFLWRKCVCLCVCMCLMNTGWLRYAWAIGICMLFSLCMGFVFVGLGPHLWICVCVASMCFTLVCVHGRACCVQCRVLPKLQATSAGGCSLITVINLASDRGWERQEAGEFRGVTGIRSVEKGGRWGRVKMVCF